MPDWKKIKAEYIRGGTSFRKLAEKHGVSFSSVKRHAAAEKWTDCRRKSEQKATTKMIENAATAEAERADMFNSIADKLLQMISEGIDNGSIIAVTGKGYRDITGALKDLREIKGIRSELDVQEQIARIAKLRKDAEDDSENKDINVILDPTLDEYSN